MKFDLVVLTKGKWEGKVVAVNAKQFIIGRDPACNLRPASAVISKKHCELIVRGEKAFVKDFGSTNGTYLNSERFEGERELANNDELTIGPLKFRVCLKATVPIDTPTPVPASRKGSNSEDDEAAALLLSLQDDNPSSVDLGRQELDSQGIPTGSTVMENISSLKGEQNNSTGGAADREKAAKAASADTSAAAKAILDKYLRRPRV